jgi:hypothetical protein
MIQFFMEDVYVQVDRYWKSYHWAFDRILMSSTKAERFFIRGKTRYDGYNVVAIPY